MRLAENFFRFLQNHFYIFFKTNLRRYYGIFGFVLLGRMFQGLNTRDGPRKMLFVVCRFQRTKTLILA